MKVYLKETYLQMPYTGIDFEFSLLDIEWY